MLESLQEETQDGKAPQAPASLPLPPPKDPQLPCWPAEPPDGPPNAKAVLERRAAEARSVLWKDMLKDVYVR